VSQVQVATQTTTTVQSAGITGEQASDLETTSAPQVTSATTQIQLGCRSACFGTTKADPSPPAVTQLVLAELSSLVPPTDSTSRTPSSAVGQSTVEQYSYQVQQGGPAAAQTQTQIAVQTSAAVQIPPVAADLPALLQPPAAVPGPQVESQARQQTWQLQIGCLFYCVNTQQVQEATQSTTTVVIVSGPPGSSDASGAAAVVVSQQTVWQLQIGCLAWCWDSTQSQTASSTQVTTLPGTGPPSEGIPAAGPGPAPAPSPAPVAASGTPIPSSAPATPTQEAGGQAPIRLFHLPRATGRAILTIGSVESAVATVIRPGQWHAAQRATTRHAFADAGAIAKASPRPAPHRRPVPHRRSIRTSSPESAAPAAISAKPVRKAANSAKAPPLVALLLAVAAAATLTVIVRRGHG
jgi:hypothetical protein